MGRPLTFNGNPTWPTSAAPDTARLEIAGGKSKRTEISVSGDMASGVTSSKTVRCAKLTASANGVGVWAGRVRFQDCTLSGGRDRRRVGGQAAARALHVRNQA
jgi:hypothetical protein